MTSTPWTRFVLPKQYAPTSTGAPMAGALLYFYASGTSDPLATFSDAELAVPNVNPMVADQNGFFGEIFLQETSYKVVLTDPTGKEIYTADPVAPYFPTVDEQAVTVILELTVDGNGSVPNPGICGDLYCPFDCTITAAVMQATGTGSCVVDVWVAPFVVNTPPNAGNSIVAGDPPTLENAQSNIDTVLTGWSLDVAAGSALRFNLVSIDTIERFTLSLVATRTASA